MKLLPLFGLLSAGILITCAGGHAQAQTSPGLAKARSTSDASKPRSTRLEVILLADQPGSAIHTQTWRTVFQELNLSVQIRRPNLDGRPGVTESMLGRLRVVNIVGTLDSRGRFVIAERSFTASDTPAIKEWLQSLETYGAQGAPQGQPLWGLTQIQFVEFYKRLSPATDQELLGSSATQIESLLNWPTEHPMTWSVAAQELREKESEGLKVKQTLRGLSLGTSLAIALNDLGFGFHPNRRPDGSIECFIEPLNQLDQPWPIGWPLTKSRAETAPQLFRMERIILDEAPLRELLSRAQESTKVPILYDDPLFAAHNITLEKPLLFTPRRAGWLLAVQQMAAKERCAVKFWQDEGGRPFLWVTPALFPTKRPVGIGEEP